MRIIKKPWGHEEIWSETDKYVGKILYIQAGHRLSLQYHERKTETIRVMQGALTLTTQDRFGVVTDRKLQVGESYHVAPGTIHRFCATDHDVVLVEVSTPDLDDVVRIEDDYTRTT
jgi:mannose-6-phosphate isomerase-like protein (cupin superfamily)